MASLFILFSFCRNVELHTVGNLEDNKYAAALGDFSVFLAVCAVVFSKSFVNAEHGAQKDQLR